MMQSHGLFFEVTQFFHHWRYYLVVMEGLAIFIPTISYIDGKAIKLTCYLRFKTSPWFYTAANMSVPVLAYFALTPKAMHSFIAQLIFLFVFVFLII